MKFDSQYDVEQVDDQTVAFHYGFSLEGKSADDEVITELENGDLIIEGYAAVFSGLDRENENFTTGAFDRGIKAFIDRATRPLCFHHKKDIVLGEVISLTKEEGKGLKMRARVDFQPEGSPWRHLYNGIKKGSIRGLSVGGFFKRVSTAAGLRIGDTDITEISVTPVPCHPHTEFSVVAGKALDFNVELEPQDSSEYEGLNELVSKLDDVFAKVEPHLSQRKVD